jgi:iron complex outermembrane receptor protein
MEELSIREILRILIEENAMEKCTGSQLRPAIRVVRRASSAAALGAMLILPIALFALTCEAAGDPTDGAGAPPAKTSATVSTAAPSPVEGTTTSLQEIIVTAQKREQSINDVGMSITALNDQQLFTLGVNDIADLTKIEPSFVVSNSSYGAPVYSIRGVGYNEKSLAASPAVSVYVDEVPYAYPSLTKAATLDLERVEVLKGPQGTLFGQNATGGAINYIAAKPTDKPETGFELTYGRFGAVNINGFVSGPVADTLNARLAFDTSQGGAWQRSVTTGASLGKADTVKARLLLDWNPTSDLHFALNVNGWTDKSDSLAAQLEKATPEDTKYIAGLGPVLQAQLIGLVAQINNSPVVLNDRAADWNTGTEPMLDETFYQTALRGEYSFSPDVELTSITSYENYQQNDLVMNAGIALNNNDEQEMGSVNSLSQELRLSGRAFDNALNWLGGLDFAKDRVTEHNIGNLPESTPAYAFAAALPPFSSIGIYGSSDATTKAAFGNLEYKILPDLSVHGGVRYTKSDIDFNGCLYNTDNNFAGGLGIVQGLTKGFNNVIPTPIGACDTLNAQFNPALVVESLDQNNVSWRVGPDWHITPDSLLYASVSKGYKAGSFPVLPGTGAIQFEPATQESLLAYEVGYKGELFARTLALDASYFHYDYRNKQLLGRILDPAGVFGVIDGLVNVPKSTEDGVELSATWRPVGGLSINFSGTYLDARVTGFFTTYDPFTGNLTNFNGYTLPNTPRWIGNLGTQYQWTLPSGLVASVGADYHYQTASVSAFVANADYAPGAQYAPGYSAGSLAISPYGLVDLRAGIASADGRWNVSLWGKNVTDKYYWTQAFHVYDTTVRYTGMPATYGITLRYRFSGI